LLDRFQDEGRMILDLDGTSVSSLRLGGGRAVKDCQLPPADRARRTDTEPLGRPPTRYSTLNRSNDTVPKITR